MGHRGKQELVRDYLFITWKLSRGINWTLINLRSLGLLVDNSLWVSYISESFAETLMIFLSSLAIFSKMSLEQPPCQIELLSLEQRMGLLTVQLNKCNVFLWSNGWIACLCVCQLLSLVWLFATPWTVAHQAPLSMGFSRQEYWSGLPFLSPGDRPDTGIELGSPTWQADP